MLTSNLLPSSAQDQVLLDLDDGALEKKVCTGPCGRGLPLSAFKKHKTGKYGRYSWCRECCSKKGKDQRKANPLTEEERKVSRERSKVFRDSHPFSEEERVVERERHRVYYSKNSERRLAASKLWKVNHPEQAKATYHAWLKNNPEQAKASSKRWRENNPERVRELYTNWVSSNRERVRALKRKWHTEHPEARLRRYAIVQDSDFTFDQWLEILNEFGFQCAYCGCSNMKLTQDHRVPISKGGTHTRSNIVPACQPCNSKKGSKDPHLFPIVVKKQANQNESRE